MKVPKTVEMWAEELRTANAAVNGGTDTKVYIADDSAAGAAAAMIFFCEAPPFNVFFFRLAYSCCRCRIAFPNTIQAAGQKLRKTTYILETNSYTN